MKRLLRTLLLASLGLLSGCANWALKERCEKTNWFEYSQQVAFQGRYLEEDPLVKECKKVDIISAQQIDLGFKLGREKMCTYEEIFARGKAGDPVFFKFCDGLEKRLMWSRHQDGLKIFCTKEVGYNYGRAGKEYQKVCNAEQERIFLPTYFKGRREYLKDRIEHLTGLIKELNLRYASYSQSEGYVSREYSGLPSPQECSTISVYNEYTKKDESRLVCKESWYIQNQRSKLHNQLSEIRQHMNDLRIKMREATQEIETSQLELTKIPLQN